MRLTLHNEPMHRDADGIPRIGCRRLVVRDDFGREVETSVIACGQLGAAVASLLGQAVSGEQTDTAVVCETVELDAGAEYILLLVPYQAVNGDG